MISKKSITALSAMILAASAALYVAPAMAQTSVKISGDIDVELNSQTSAATGQRATTINGASFGPNGGMQTSYFQISGDEDLGGGMKAGFALGSFIQPAIGVQGRFPGDPLFSRDANISLSGDFGKITAGRQINPMFLSMLLFNPFADSFGYSPIIQQTYYAFAAGNVLSTDTGYSDAVSYSTPNFSGFSARLLYSLSQESGVSGSFSGNALYFNGPFAATFAYESSTVSAANNTFSLGGGYPAGTTEKVAQLGVSYELTPVKLFLQYLNSDTSPPGVASTSYNTFQFGGKMEVGKGYILASYAKTGGIIDHKTFSLAYDYYLSKSTDLYAAYMNDQAAAYANTIDSLGIGMRHRF
jgi:predicted porin